MLLHVWMHGAPLGVVTHEPTGQARFEYDDADPAATPLSTAMPATGTVYPDKVITPWLWGLLPENPQVLARWARQYQTSAASAPRLLATPIGRDCPGAVQFTPDANPPARTGDIEWLDDQDVGALLRQLREDQTAWLGSATTGQFSLAGAQRKTALLHDQGRWGLPSGATPTTHVLKPAISGLDGHDINEHLCLTAARQLGLRAAITRVETFGDEQAIVVTRYDRAPVDDGTWQRIHQEDFCQATSTMPTQKYQNEGGPGPTQIGHLLRRLLPSSQAETAVGQFVDALLYNWVIAGTDAHAKNYSLLLSGQQVRLAPLYDIASILPYDSDWRGMKLAMKMGGSYRLKDLWARNVLELANELKTDPATTIDRAMEIATEVPAAISEAAADPAVRALEHRLPARLIDRVAERASTCLTSLQRLSTA